MTEQRPPDLLVRVEKVAGYELSASLRHALDDLARAVVDEAQSNSDEDVSGFSAHQLDMGAVPSSRLTTPSDPLGFTVCLGHSFGQCKLIYYNGDD